MLPCTCMSSLELSLQLPLWCPLPINNLGFGANASMYLYVITGAILAASNVVSIANVYRWGTKPWYLVVAFRWWYVRWKIVKKGRVFLTYSHPLWLSSMKIHMACWITKSQGHKSLLGIHILNWFKKSQPRIIDGKGYISIWNINFILSILYWKGKIKYYFHMKMESF